MRGVAGAQEESGRGAFCDGHHWETRTLEGSSAGPTEPERAYGALAGERRSYRIGALRAQGTHQAVGASRTTCGIALLTEIRPADDPSTVRLQRR